MLTVVQSNRLETLADRLAVALGASPAPPLAPEIVVVQSGGMARWLAMRIASRLGVCANVRFPFPAELLWEIARELVPGVPDAPALEPAVTTWHLMAILAALPADAVFAPLRVALGTDDERRRFELARQLADVFDQYLVYRPDWILAWERGEETHWQAALWRQVVAREPRAHRARVWGAVSPGARAGATLPARIALFGISALPPAELDAFGRLAAHLDVQLFVLNPCREYWGDVVAERDLPRRTGTHDAEELHLTTGNPLLASLGRPGRDFIDRVQEYAAAEVDLFEEPDTGTLLGCLQSDVLHLRDRRDGAERPALSADDDSVQAHACHGPMREVEVLHDRLLALFAAEPTLTPADVVVMTPDVERYAPCVEAVFSTAPPAQRIPFTIADVSLRAESAVVDAFLGLLELPESRYEANRLLALLAVDAVRRRFGMTEAEAALAHRWVRESGVRWATDAAQRAALELPATAEHTWRFGLDRLLLGYAMRGEGRHCVGGVLPYDEVEGTSARVLGRLVTFVEAAFGLRERLAVPRPPAEWGAALGALLDEFFAPDDEEDETALAAVRDALGALVGSAGRARFTAPVSLALVRAELRRALEVPVRTGRFLAGSVTVCAMVPMRSIPFAVVCLLGMNDDAFPRRGRRPSFDRMVAEPRRGDRSRRDDDRALFLEALLSARRCLYLSWTGRDIRDNRRLPPSVVVSELLDYVERAYGRQLVVEHPLQAFSRRYFDGSNPALFSFAAERCEATQRLLAGAPSPRVFVRRLPEADVQWRTVDVEQLVRFWQGPVRYLLRERLGLRLEEVEDVVESREPFVLSPLERWALRSRLLEWRLAGNPLSAALSVVRAAGLLPHGRVGEVVFARACEEIEPFAARVEAARVGAPIVRLPIDLPLGPVRLTGTLGDVRQAGLVNVRVGRVRAKDRVALWVRHLVLGCVAPGDVARESRLIGEDGDLVLGPVAAPAKQLRVLADRYWEGIHRPLPFFPESALAAVRAKQDPLEAAQHVFASPRRPEKDDPYLELVFGEEDPLGRAPLKHEFLELARVVFGPLEASARRDR